MDKFEREILTGVLVGACMLSYATAPVQADSLDSSQYRIRYSNINFGSTDSTSTSYDLSTTAGQLAAQEFSSAGYVVKAGFQYWRNVIPFTFAVSDLSIPLGILTPQIPSTATTQLTVTFGEAGQYQVTASEIGTLRTLDGKNSILDTVCNGGGQTCIETTANVWNSKSTYGFGYNMTGDDIPADFVNSTYYRPFADSTLSEAAAAIMSSTDVTASSVATITFKANISNVQPAGSYQTVIKLMAAPSF